MNSDWFVLKQGKWHGPLSAQKLKSLATSDRLRKTDVVRQGSQGSAVAASRVKGLFSDVSSTPKAKQHGTLVITRLTSGSGLRKISISIDGEEKGQLGSGFPAALFEGEKSLILCLESGEHSIDLVSSEIRRTVNVTILEGQKLEYQTFVIRGAISFRNADSVQQPDSLPDEWHYVSKGEKKGPVTKHKLRMLAWARSVNGATLVYRSGFDDWKIMADVAPDVFEHQPTPGFYRLPSWVLPSWLISNRWGKIAVLIIVAIFTLLRMEVRRRARVSRESRPSQATQQQRNEFRVPPVRKPEMNAR